jgi:hypothetical protein
MTDFTSEQLIVLDVLKTLRNALRTLPTGNAKDTIKVTYTAIFTDLASSVGKHILNKELPDAR